MGEGEGSPGAAHLPVLLPNMPRIPLTEAPGWCQAHAGPSEGDVAVRVAGGAGKMIHGNSENKKKKKKKKVWSFLHAPGAQASQP